MSARLTYSRQVVLVSALLTAIALLFGLSAPAAADGTGYTFIGKQVYPESLATDRHYVYATSLADGTVYRGKLSGSTLSPFLPGGANGRTTATGIKSTGTRLLVAGAATGRLYVYDARSGARVATYTVPNAGQPTYLNDEIVTANGDVYVTDSLRPVIYRIPAAEVNAPATGAERTLRTAITLPTESYTAGYNANGIVASPDGQTLLVVYYTSGALYRVDVQTGTTTQVKLDRPLLNGDGLLLLGHTLYAARNFDNLIVTLRISSDLTTATTLAERTYSGADVPTSLAFSHGRLLILNSQFDTFIKHAPQTSQTFTISSVPLY
ncbi:MAG: superoxide dismutase [Acidimicrobiales bacterium]|nr:MAG: superoxide dismutase [Acidimicrobiales bacterium]